MTNILKIMFLMTTLSFICCQNKDSDSLDGKTFIGFEEEIYFDSPRQVFQTIMTFKNDSVILQKNRIYISNNDTLNFKKGEENYQYKGLVKKNRESIKFISYAYKCNYCPTIVDDKGKLILDYVEYKGIISGKGLKLNGKNFKLK